MLLSLITYYPSLGLNLSNKISEIFQTVNDIGYRIIFANVLAIFNIHNVVLPAITFLLLATAIFFTFKLSFINLTQLIPGIKMILSGQDSSHGNNSKNNVSSLKALFAVIAGAAGLGNIVGVSAAIFIGGPGAVFWMILTPIISMPIRFAEVYAAHSTRIKTASGNYLGGPSRYLSERLKTVNLPRLGVFLSVFYTVTMTIGSLGGGSSFQSNQVVRIITASFDILNDKSALVSLFFTGFISIVIFGGVKRIINFLAAITPFLIGLYFSSCLLVLIVNHKNILPSLLLIFKSAFSFKACTGAAVGAFIIGFNRIIIATETALGTASIIHSNSSNPNSAKEAILSMASPVIDTLFVCLMTALAVVVTNVHDQDLQGILMIKAAFATVSPIMPYIILILVPVMGANVVIVWSYYGMNSCASLFNSERAGKLFRLLYIGCVFGGGIIEDFDIILKFTDVVNTSAAIPNTIGLMLMSGYIKEGYQSYLKSKLK